MSDYLLLLLGSSTDEFYAANGWPIEGTYSETKDNGKAAGGPPLNMGCVCAANGGNVKCLDYLSDNNESSKFIVSVLNKYGIDTSNVQYGKAVNGKVVIVNTGDKRTMFVVMPERPFYKIDNKLQDLLNNAKYIYSMMHIVNRSFENIEPLLEAKKHGAKIIFDGCCEYDKDWEFSILYSLADGLFINTQDYANLKNNSDKDPKEYLFSKGCEFICITDGENGSTCYTKDGEYKADACLTTVTDSTGAGDSFAGTFIYSLQKGYDYQKALRLASVSGSLACTALGGQAACHSEAELYEYAKKHNYQID